jgi:hypothetical protein
MLEGLCLGVIVVDPPGDALEGPDKVLLASVTCEGARDKTDFPLGLGLEIAAFSSLVSTIVDALLKLIDARFTIPLGISEATAPVSFRGDGGGLEPPAKPDCSRAKVGDLLSAPETTD